MHVLILGAGVVGVTSAYYLARDGHEVTVIEAREGPGLETSFANGGQISASHAYPWADPGVPLKVLKWLGRRNAPLRFSPRLDPAQWLWAARFLANCRRRPFLENAARSLRLALLGRDELGRLREETKIAYDAECRGILHFFRTQAGLDAAAAVSERLREWGCASRVLDTAACLALEPALAPHQDALAGGIHAPEDESGDAHLFTRGLAGLAAGRGVTFHYGERVRALEAEGGRVAGIVTDRATRRADAYVVALASWSTALLRPLGLRLPIYPLKGYSITVPVTDTAKAPRVSLLDEANKVVYSRFGARLRAAGKAHLAGFDADVDPAQAEGVLDVCRRQFPDAADYRAASFWAGLRPMTPDGSPILGRTRYGNLFLNTGHGALGWTMCCGSARLLTDLLAERPSALDPADYAYPRQRLSSVNLQVPEDKLLGLRP